jgi:hypothetical protein
MLRDFIDGIPLDLAAKLLPVRTRLNLGLVRTYTLTREPNADTLTALQMRLAVSPDPGS